MSKQVIRALAQQLAEQTYMNHLLAKRLVTQGILKPGELQQLYESNPAEREEFFRDFLSHLISIGLEND